MVEIREGSKDAEDVNFELAPLGSICGQILDEDQKALAGIDVFLIAAEYYRGSLRTMIRNRARSDKAGFYCIGAVEGKRAHLVWATRWSDKLDVVAPATPSATALESVFFPNSPRMESAGRILLEDGEQRDNVDFRLRRLPAHCIKGRIDASFGGNMVNLQLHSLVPEIGMLEDSGVIIPFPGAHVKADTKFQVCGLTEGEYELVASAPKAACRRTIEIQHNDVEDVLLTPELPASLTGEIRWHSPPDPPREVRGMVALDPINRQSYEGERPGGIFKGPGKFRIDGLFPDRYALRNLNFGPGVYVKSVKHSGADVQYAPFVVGSADLVIELALDGGEIVVRLEDFSAGRLPGYRVLAYPKSAVSPGAMADQLRIGELGLDGSARFSNVPPGEYMVFVTRRDLAKSEEAVAGLLADRVDAKPLTVLPMKSNDVVLRIR
jgi:hypothetical protein